GADPGEQAVADAFAEDVQNAGGNVVVSVKFRADAQISKKSIAKVGDAAADAIVLIGSADIGPRIQALIDQGLAPSG
ncbi:MAG TPA: hypothetical protein VMT88_01875, partial [Actinomycetes bacterium]|nr:hypothetical protein [Actinomycetes bacterium]